MIQVAIPRKNLIQLPAVRVTADYHFNFPTDPPDPLAGRFVVNQDRVKLTNLDRNSIYFISAFSFSSSLPENQYLTSTDPTAPLTIQMKTKQSVHIYKYPISMLTYHQNSELNHFIKTDNSDDELQASFTGSFYQIADTIGLRQIVLQISLFMYQIDNNEYNKFFNSDMETLQSGKY